MSGRFCLLTVFVGFVLVKTADPAEDISCSRIDFNQATVTFLAQCSFYQEFVSKPYVESHRFRPFRPETEYYLSNRWQGLTCGETIQSYSVNEQTELRMVYHLIFDSGATLEVRVVNLDHLDGDNKPTVVIRWKTEQATTGWGLFREKMDRTIKRAKIEIEANMNAGSDVAIEYFTVYNYEIETDECQSLDEFAPTTTPSPVTTTTPTPTSTTQISSTTSTTTIRTTTTQLTTSSTTEDTDIESTKPETSTPATTTFSPRDNNTTTTIQAMSSSTPYFTPEVPSSTEAPPSMGASSTPEWIWMALAATFAALFCLAMASVAYIYAANKHLQNLGRAGLKGEDLANKIPYSVFNNRNRDTRQQQSVDSRI